MSESHEIEQIARVLAEHRGRPWADVKLFREMYLGQARAILPLIRAAEAKGAENMRERAVEWHKNGAAGCSMAADDLEDQTDPRVAEHHDRARWHRLQAEAMLRFALPPIKEG